MPVAGFSLLYSVTGIVEEIGFLVPRFSQFVLREALCAQGLGRAFEVECPGSWSPEMLEFGKLPEDD